MTFFLIVAVIAVIIALCQDGKKAKKKSDYHNYTITSVPLEKQFREIYTAKVETEINKRQPPVGELFTTLIDLFNYYDVPIQGCSILSDFVREAERLKVDTLTIIAEEWKMAENFYYEFQDPIHKYEEKMAKKKALPKTVDSKGVERTAIDYAQIIKYYYKKLAEDADLFSKKDDWLEKEAKKINLTMDEIVSRIDEFKALYFANPITTTKTPVELLHFYMDTPYNVHLLRDSVVKNKYSDLITLLTRRAMRTVGFGLSPDGRHDSKWQEEQRNHATYEELKKKYPWNYPKD